MIFYFFSTIAFIASSAFISSEKNWPFGIWLMLAAIAFRLDAFFSIQ